VEEIREGCKSASLGCVQCKKHMMKVLNDFIAPIRDKKNDLMNTPEGRSTIQYSIQNGKAKAQMVAKQTIQEIKELFHFEVKHV
jgi:tryptophanyl-tRNA synthetase